MGRRGKRKQKTDKTVPPQLGETSAKRIPKYKAPSLEGNDVIVHSWGPYSGGLRLRFSSSLDPDGIPSAVKDTMYITQLSDNSLLAVKRLPPNPTRSPPYISGFAVSGDEMEPARLMVKPGSSFLVKPFHQQDHKYGGYRLKQDGKDITLQTLYRYTEASLVMGKHMNLMDSEKFTDADINPQLMYGFHITTRIDLCDACLKMPFYHLHASMQVKERDPAFPKQTLLIAEYRIKNYDDVIRMHMSIEGTLEGFKFSEKDVENAKKTIATYEQGGAAGTSTQHGSTPDLQIIGSPPAPPVVIADLYGPHMVRCQATEPPSDVSEDEPEEDNKVPFDVSKLRVCILDASGQPIKEFNSE